MNMVRGLYTDRPECIRLHDVPAAALQPTQVRIRTTLAAIKHGTTFHLFSGKSPFQGRRFDKELRLFVAREAAEAQGGMSETFVGNMIAGVVREAGPEVTKFKSGDRVFCYGPACEEVVRAEGAVEWLPPEMSDADAVCLDPALFAFCAVRDGRIGLCDNAAVFGMGAIGLFAVQMLRLNGCQNIVAVEPAANRRALAERFGATLVLNPSECDVGLEIRKCLGTGVDVAIEASGNYAALNQAIRSVRQCGRVVTLGYYKGGAAGLELGAEWLHNRQDMICSMPDWGNPSRDHPAWDRDRMWRTLISLFRSKALTSDGVLDPIVDLDEAPGMFMSIYHNAELSVKMGVRFDR